MRRHDGTATCGHRLLYAARQQDLAEAMRARQQAEARIETARLEDRAAFARARDAGRPDPGAKAEQAGAALADAERRQDGEQLRADQARDALLAALREQGPAWCDRLGRAWAKLDAEAVKALQKFMDVEARRRATRAAALWAGDVATAPDIEAALRTRPCTYAFNFTSVKDAAHQGARLTADALTQGLEDFIDLTSAAAFQAGAAERADARDRAERLAALRTHDRLEVRAAATHVDGGSLDLEEAEAVAEGAALEDVQEAAARRRAADRPLAWG